VLQNLVSKSLAESSTSCIHTSLSKSDKHLAKHYRYTELCQTLNRYLLDAQKEVTKVTKELLKVEDQLTQCRNWLKRANIVQELQDRFSVPYPLSWTHSCARKDLDSAVMTTWAESRLVMDYSKASLLLRC
jgi:hypothetical protein